MKIDANPKPLSALLPIQGSDQYNIPEYQRDYSWKDEQIDQLFEDIYDEDEGYYVGNLLVTPQNEDSTNSPVLDVIDGQQRLITLSLFLVAIWQRFNQLQQMNRAAGTAQLPLDDSDSIATTNYKIKCMLFTEEGKGTPRIRPLESDQEVYDSILAPLIGKDRQRLGKYKFSKRYKHICSLFEPDKKDHQFADVQAIVKFFNKLCAVTLLQINVGSLNDAFMVFSSLNSKGLPLTLVDLLKGEFLRAAPALGEERKDTLDKWKLFTASFQDQNGNVNIGAATQFLLNNYDAFEGGQTSSTTKGKALKQYQTIIKNRYQSGIDYLQSLLNRVSCFTQIARLSHGAAENTEIDEKLESLHKLEASQAYPLLLFLMVKQHALGLEDNQLNTILDELIYFYVRRNVTLLPKASGIRSNMLAVIKDINDNDSKGADIVSLILNRLTAVSVSKDDFRNHLLNADIYDQNAKTTRFLLISLERNLSGPTIFDKGNKDSLDSLLNSGKPKWNIEHILPEGPLPDYWKNAISPDCPDDATKVQEDYTHKLGNLTLTTYNPDLGQLPFIDINEPYRTDTLSYKKSKRDLSDNGHFVGLRQQLRLNDSIPNKSVETIETKTQWTIADIERRTKILTDFIVKYYDFDNLR